jgi:hypothetical protein
MPTVFPGLLSAFQSEEAGSLGPGSHPLVTFPVWPLAVLDFRAGRRSLGEFGVHIPGFEDKTSQWEKALPKPPAPVPGRACFSWATHCLLHLKLWPQNRPTLNLEPGKHPSQDTRCPIFSESLVEVTVPPT